MDYKKLIKALKCDGYGISQDMDGCSNRRCKYRDTDGACNIVSICLDASKAITDLLERAEVAEARCKAFEKMAREYQNVIVPGYRERAEKAERQRDAAVGDIESMMAYGGKLNTCHYCRNGQCYERGGTKPCLPKWYQEEE